MVFGLYNFLGYTFLGIFCLAAFMFLCPRIDHMIRKVTDRSRVSQMVWKYKFELALLAGIFIVTKRSGFALCVKADAICIGTIVFFNIVRQKLSRTLFSSESALRICYYSRLPPIPSKSSSIAMKNRTHCEPFRFEHVHGFAGVCVVASFFITMILS